MTEDLSYMERTMYRQSLLTDLVILGANAKGILETFPDITTEQLEGLVAGLLKLQVLKHEL